MMLWLEVDQWVQVPGSHPGMVVFLVPGSNPGAPARVSAVSAAVDAFDSRSRCCDVSELKAVTSARRVVAGGAESKGASAAETPALTPLALHPASRSRRPQRRSNDTLRCFQR